MHDRDGCARRHTPSRAKLRHGLGCTEGTAPSGGWVRRQRRRTIGRRRAGLRRIELTLHEIVVFRSVPKAARSISFFFRTGKKENRLGGSGNQSMCEGADQVGYGAEVAVDNGSGTAHDRCAHHHEEQFFFSFFRWVFDEAVPVDYVPHWIF